MDKRKQNKGVKGNSGAKFWGKDNREKAATLKGLVIDECIKVLKSTEEEDEKFKRDIILRLATSCIPQEHKHSGNENDNTPIPIINVLKEKCQKESTKRKRIVTQII